MSLGIHSAPQHHQRLRAAAQRGAQDLSAEGADAAAQGEVAVRLPPAARLLRRPVPREGSQPHRAGQCLTLSHFFKSFTCIIVNHRFILVNRR